METITIQVPSEIAQAYREAQTQLQLDASLFFKLIIKELLNPTPFNILVEQIRSEAADNGLTPDILAELLKDE